MATELIRRTWCDRCLTDLDQRVEGTVNERFTIGQKIVEIDLCESCAELLLTPLQEIVRLGRPPSPRDVAEVPPRGKVPDQQQRKGNQDYDCPVCPAEYKTRQTFRKHLTEAHGMSFAEYLKSIGKEAFPCSHKGCDFVGVDLAGLNLHKLRSHPQLAASNGRRG